MTLVSRSAGLLARLARCSQGVTAVEFGLIGPIFFGMVFATMDVGGLLTQSMLLDRALDKTVRTVRVRGGLTTIGQAAFRDSVCTAMAIYSPSCPSRLTVEMTVIKTGSSFPNASVPCVSQAAPAPTVAYDSGARSDMVFVRVCYVVDPMLPFLGPGLGLPRNASGSFNVVSTSGFVNEP